MSKVVIDINAKDIATIKDGDILVYNEEKRMFYKQTAEEFWRRHDEQLARIIKRYDEIVTKLEKRIQELEEKENEFEINVENHEQEHEEQVDKIISVHENQEKEFEDKIKNITNKLIVMVENFIKTGGNL